MKFGDIDIDDFKISGLCRTSIRLAKAFYADPENMRRYEEWKAKRDSEKEYKVARLRRASSGGAEQ